MDLVGRNFSGLGNYVVDLVVINFSDFAITSSIY